MRSVRTILGLALAACLCGAFATSALAAEPPPPSGTFKASITGQTISEATPATTRGHGTVTTLRLGPYLIECEKELKAKGKVTAEESKTFSTEVKFSGCTTTTKEGGGLLAIRKIHFTLSMEYHANGFLELVGTEVSFKASGSQCMVQIPTQTIPVAAVKKPEAEYAAVTFGTEKEPIESKKFPSGIREKLSVTMEVKKVFTQVKPNSACKYVKEPEGKFNPETGYVEYNNGEIEAELEEVEVKNGNFSFEPPV